MDCRMPTDVLCVTHADHLSYLRKTAKLTWENHQ